MLLVWAAVAASFLALLAYKGQLTRYEEDQLFLSEVESHDQRVQSDIVRKVKKIEPFVRILGIAAAVMTITIVSVYTYDAWLRIR